jgi:hypothetical protein
MLAIITERWLPGKWYIVIGGIGGALVPALQTVFKSKKKALPKLPNTTL